MSILVTLTPHEETLLAQKAAETGLATAQFVENLVRTHLTSEPIPSADRIRAKLRQWQGETGTEIVSVMSVHELFAQWAEEDAQKTDAEIAADEKLWQEYQQGIDDERTESGMRTLFHA